MDLTTIFTIITIVLGITYFVGPKVYNYFYKRPKLIVEIEPNKGITSSQTFLSFSTKNPTGVPVNTPEGN